MLPARPSGCPHHTRLHQTARATKAQTIPALLTSLLLSYTQSWSGRSLMLSDAFLSVVWQVVAAMSVLIVSKISADWLRTGYLVYLLCGWMMRLCRSKKCTFPLSLPSMNRTDWHSSCSGSRWVCLHVCLVWYRILKSHCSVLNRVAHTFVLTCFAVGTVAGVCGPGAPAV